VGDLTAPVRIERYRNIRIPVRRGFELDCDIVRPVTTERVPVILCVFPFDKDGNVRHRDAGGDQRQIRRDRRRRSNFYGRRGYAQVFLSLRGTGDSGGAYDHMGPGMIEDIYDAIEWLAKQPWCDGQAATFGTSFFSMPIKLVAQLKPPSLKAIFAPFGTDDQYRRRCSTAASSISNFTIGGTRTRSAGPAWTARSVRA